ncbi:flagellar hook-associated protein 2 [Acidovorax sp. 107]|uniref:flagellar filament capping protein FliD n=1 Tax=Acidovorax sp. 107 TaxID=2135638 RepID=UPI000D371F3C|nr:flagellar filament capping protein FliD [Acidovorax sp. 107]PUA97575.1 flagellar hook-associated protein 2 [Acidovorax sp. 107]
MASFSSIGVGLGGSVDVNGLIKASVDAVKIPITKTNGLNDQASFVSAKISTFGQLKSMVSDLSAAVSKLNSVTGWNAVTTTSSNTDYVSATATGGTVATSFSVEVQSLAKAQTMASAPLLPVGGFLGVGALKLELGTPQTIAAGTATSIELGIGPNDKLSDVAGKINGANVGVTATILSDASGERLLLRSKTTGADAGFRLSVTDGDGNNTDASGLSRLVNGAAIEAGANAQATVNGMAVSSATNQFVNTVAGVTFNAVKVTTAPVEITVAKDDTAVKSNIDAFVKAYNTLNQALNNITKYDKDTKTAGLLQGDSTAIGLQNALRNAIQSLAGGTGPFRSLSDIGVVSAGGLSNLSPTGDLEVNASKLNKALENPDAVKAMFRGPDSGGGNDGVAEKINAVTAGLLSTTGFFASKDKLLQGSLKLNAQEIQRVNDQADRLETSLKARYTALDKQMSQLNALNAYIAQQVTTWNKSSG